MSTEIEQRTAFHATPMIRGEELDDAYRLAKALALSKRFPDARTAEEALAKILVGRELGLGPVQAMMGLHIVDGKPMVASITLASFVRTTGKYDYRVLTHTDDGCAIEFGPHPAPGKDAEGNWISWPEAAGVSSFSTDDAERAGLMSRNNWKNFPRNMVFARAMSNGIKWFCPDATFGIPVYHEGEIEPERFVDGASVEGTAAESASVALGSVAESLPTDLRQRFYDAYGDAANVRPGQLTAAVAQMALKDQPRERIVSYLEAVEAANARAREESMISDAEVVAPDDLAPDPEVASPEGGASTPAASGVSETEPAPRSVSRHPLFSKGSSEAAPASATAPGDASGGSPPSEPDSSVETLRTRLGALRERQGSKEGLSVEEADLVVEEIEWIEGELRKAGADVPGQEVLARGSGL